MGLLEDSDLLPKAGPANRISFRGLRLNDSSGRWRRFVYFVARDDLRSRLLVSEGLQRNCLNSHCGGFYDCSEFAWLEGIMIIFNACGVDVYSNRRKFC